MINFFKGVLSENGTPSSKRVAFFILLFAFLVECAVNLIWNRLLSDTLRDQLYYALLTALGAIFVVNIGDKIKEIKITQSNNNAAVGAASPPPAPNTTIVK